MVFGGRGLRRRGREVDDASDADSARGARDAAARRDDGAHGRGVSPGRGRLVPGAGGLPALVGAEGLLLVVLPDERAVRAELERDGHVEADRHQRGKEQAAELHATILPGNGRAPHSAASR